MSKNTNYIILAILLILLAFWFYKNNNRTVTDDTVDRLASSTDLMGTSTASSTDMTGTSSTRTTQTDNSKKLAQIALQKRLSLGYPNSWPADVPTYPNQTVKYTGGNNPQSGPVEATIVFTTPDSVKTVLNFYLSGLVANGWKITENGNGLANQITFRATKAKRTAGGYIVREGNGKTTVTVGVNIGI